MNCRFLKLVRTVLLLSTAVIAFAADCTALTVTVAPDPPIVDAGPAKVIAFPAKDLTLFGHATDPNNYPITAQWTLTDGPAPVRFSAPWGLATTVTFTTTGTYTFQLAVSDGTFNSTSSTTVTVNPASSQTEFYVDPTYTGSVETGDAATPWKTLIETDPLSKSRWGTINAALAAGPVIIYFSARTAATDTPEELVGSVRVRRTDTSTNRLTLDGMSRYNSNDANPSWVDYNGGSKMRIRTTSSCCLSIGWYSVTGGDGKLDYVTVRGFEVTGSAARITWGGSYSVLEYIWSHDVTTLGATIQFDPAVTDFPVCLDLGKSHDITVRNVLVERGIGEGLYIAGTYLYTGNGGCPDTGNNHSDILIEGNTVVDAGLNGNEGDGLDLKAGLLNVTVRNNTFVNPHNGNGIDLLGTFGSTMSNYVIEGNVIVNAPTYAGLSLQSIHGVLIRNNLIYNSKGAGIAFSGDSTYSNFGVEIYNNTLYQNGAAIQIDHVDGIILKNNLIFGNSSPGNYSTSSYITSDYNLWAPANARWSEGPYSIIQTSTSGIVQDSANGDFRLTDGGPATGTGLDLSATGFATDIRGNPRLTVAAWSIGAYEFPYSPFPVITAVTADAYDTGARITWTTDEPADSLVDYGTATSYGVSTPLATALVTSHQVDLSGLSPATTYYFRVKSRDATGNLTTGQSVTLTTLGPPTLAVSPRALADGIVGTSYNQNVTASGGTSPYTFSVPIGALPSGLALDGPSGTITGTPTQSGTATFSLKALDSLGAWGMQSYSMNASTLNGANASVTRASTAYGVVFTIPDGGGRTWIMSGPSNSLRTGYARMQQDTGNSTLSGLAILGYRSRGVLVTEASVPASTPVSNGRIYVEVNGPVTTGIAFANATHQAAVISFYFTDAGGTDFGKGSFTLNAGSQVAAFLNQAPFSGRSSMQGTFSFSSPVPVGVSAIRGVINERHEFLITTLPVATIGETDLNSIILPQFADGGGWTTQTILTNPSNSAIAGYVQFFGTGSPGQDASVLNVSVNGASNTMFSYMLAPGATTRLVTGNSERMIQAGSVRITPTSGTAPAAMAIFSFRNNGITVSEAVISGGPPGLAFRMYTEASGRPDQIGSVESGLALTNPLPAAVTVNLDLYNMDGSSPVLPVTLTVAGNRQVSRFLRELFPGLRAPFQGFLKVTATAPIAVTGVRGRYNERGDFLITTTPARNEEVTLPPDQFLFPHLISGAGYSTQLVIFGQSSSGRLWFNSSDASVLTGTLQPDH